MTMTRKHFKLIASALKASAANEIVVTTMANTLAMTNPRFDRAKFIEAATYVETVTLVAPDGRKAKVECVADGNFEFQGKKVQVFTAR